MGGMMTNLAADHERPIATRHLRMKRRDGTAVPIRIEVYAPTAAADGIEYRCRYRIIGSKQRPIEQASVGVDGIQAIHICIQMIATWMSVLRHDHGAELEWPEGSPFDNLEHCQERGRPQRDERTTTIRSDPSIDRELRNALTIMRDTPDDAERTFKRLRRRALRLGLIHQAMQCLHGELANARLRDNREAELKIARTIANSQPSAENLVVVASELEKRGRLGEARKWYERAFAVADEGSHLYEFLTGKLEKTHAMGRRGEA
jgi:hypothetical protein